jgi:hypothetical protein
MGRSGMFSVAGGVLMWGRRGSVLIYKSSERGNIGARQRMALAQ